MRVQGSRGTGKRYTVRNYSIAHMYVRLWKSHYLGRRLPDREAMGEPPLQGDLCLSSTHYRGCGYVACLSLVDPCNQTAQGELATLYEPQLLALGNGRLRFRGIEALEGRGYAQEWLIEIVVREASP
jgi:hypothetical protein